MRSRKATVSESDAFSAPHKDRAVPFKEIFWGRGEEGGALFYFITPNPQLLRLALCNCISFNWGGWEWDEGVCPPRTWRETKQHAARNPGSFNSLEINSGLYERNMNLQSQESISASEFDLIFRAPCLTFALSGTLALSRPREGLGCSVPYPPPWKEPLQSYLCCSPSNSMPLSSKPGKQKVYYHQQDLHSLHMHYWWHSAALGVNFMPNISNFFAILELRLQSLRLGRDPKHSPCHSTTHTDSCAAKFYL